jgi:hypothetical protein
MSARVALLAATAALVISAPAYAVTYISTDPYSMFYDMTWDQYDKLGDTLGDLVFASGGKIFPECAKWLVGYTPPMFEPPPDAPLPEVVTYIAPQYVTPYAPTTMPTPVPETSTWLMVLLGVMGMWWAARRRTVR